MAGKGAVGLVEVTDEQPHWWGGISRQVHEYSQRSEMPYGVSFTPVPEPGYGVIAALAGLICCRRSSGRHPF
jgi:hypothetical protein